MTVEQLTTRVGILIEDDIDAATAVGYFNSAQAVLGESVIFPTRATISYSGTGFVVPSNFLGALKFVTPSDAVYDIWDDEIHLDDSTITEITVAYNRRLADVPTTANFVPELDPMFHEYYAFWAAMQSMHPEEEPERYMQYEKDYLRLRKSIASYYGGLRVRPSQWGVTR